MGSCVSSSVDPSWAELRKSIKDIRSFGTYWEDELREMNDPNHNPFEPPSFPPGYEAHVRDTSTVSLKIWKRFEDDPQLLWKLMDLMVEAGLGSRNDPKHEEILRLLAPAPDLAEEYRQMLARAQEYSEETILWQKEHPETLVNKRSCWYKRWR